MMRQIVLLMALCGGTPLWAQPPVVPPKTDPAPKIDVGDKPITVKVGIPYEIPLQTDAASVQWVCFDPKVLFIDQKLLADKRGAVVVVREKGRYRVAVIGSDKQGAQTRKDVWIVAEDDAAEEPKKPTGPTPPPPAAPISRRLHIVFVEQDSDAVSARIAKVNGDLAAASANHKPLALDKNILERPPASVPADKLAIYSSYVRAAKSYPWLILLPIGEVKSVYSGPAPATDEEFLALLKKYGG